MPNVMAAQPTVGGALCESSVIPFLVPRRKVWLTPAAGVPCSNAANIAESNTWTQSEFCRWQNFIRGREPPKMYIHRVSKNVPPLACYNVDTRERIFLNTFGTNSTDKVRKQKTLYYARSNNLCFCSTWQNGKHKNCIFTRCISALPEFNQLLLDFFVTHTHAAV